MRKEERDAERAAWPKQTQKSEKSHEVKCARLADEDEARKKRANVRMSDL
jgi:hypothetical protein